MEIMRKESNSDYRRKHALVKKETHKKVQDKDKVYIREILKIIYCNLGDVDREH